MSPLDAWIAGFGPGLSLIVAIGARNAFALRQELRRERVFPVCLICSLPVAVLILAGLSGFHLL